MELNTICVKADGSFMMKYLLYLRGFFNGDIGLRQKSSPSSERRYK